MGQSARMAALLAVYVFILSLCWYVSYEIRFDFIVPPEFQSERLYSLVRSIPLKILFLLLFRQFESLLTYFSVPDLGRIAAAMASAALASFALRLTGTYGLASPRGVLLIDFVLSVAALSALRLGLRIYRERFLNGWSRVGKTARRIVILGAGDAGAVLAGESIAKPALGLKPVFFLDDDRSKHGHYIHGIPVLGAPEEIARWRERFPVDGCVLAMPSAPGRRVQELYRLFTAEGLKVEIVPSLAELATGRVQVTKVRPVEVEDLLGRAAVDLRSEAVTRLVQNRVVMVTGAGGSIGCELCRQLATCNPRRLLLVERAEGSLFNIELELHELGAGQMVVPLVADIQDLPRMRDIFRDHAPSIVFHAAAHKHVAMMERQPAEALKNNTTGTRLLAEAASAAGVEVFVLVSTDKAINPTSAMGATKRLAEMHLQSLQSRPGNRTRFIAVRFGNVLGSSGSVIPIFKRQIAAGGPVTVTHPEVVRFFMTIPEAVGLVLQTSALGRGGEIFVLDMGKPVRIAELARQLIELSGLQPDIDIEIKIIGLRPGEKLYEELQHGSEQLLPTTHERIRRLAAGPPAAELMRACIAELEQQPSSLESNQIKLAIKRYVPEYQPYLD